MNRRLRRLKRKYGLTPKEYRRLFRIQQGQCNICLTTDPGTQHGYFCVDHNHRTGKVRALLCNSCNLMIGFAKENPTILERGAIYLKDFEE